MNPDKKSHFAKLESMGAKDGRLAYNTLRRIQKEAHYWDCVSCNGGFLRYDGRLGREIITPHELTGADEDKIFTRLENRVKRVFGGKLPAGFFFNHDPRGYALKIKSEKNDYDLTRDWGGYGLLAPDFER